MKKWNLLRTKYDVNLSPSKFKKRGNKKKKKRPKMILYLLIGPTDVWM